MPEKSILDLINKNVESIINSIRTVGKYDSSMELEIHTAINEIYNF
jgi:hypothetical protein